PAAIWCCRRDCLCNLAARLARRGHWGPAAPAPVRPARPADRVPGRCGAPALAQPPARGAASRGCTRRRSPGRLLRSQRPARRGPLSGPPSGRPCHPSWGSRRLRHRYGRLCPLPPAGRLVVAGRGGDCAARHPAGSGVLAPAGPALAARRLDRPRGRHLRLPRAGAVSAPPARPDLSGELRRTLLLAGLCVLLAQFDGSALFLALPAVAQEFHARVEDLSNAGSVLGLGAIAALPLAALADRAGRKRLLVLAVAAFSVANLATGFAPALAWLAVARLTASCFEVAAIGIASALVVEEAPRERRAIAVAALTIAAGAGQGLTIVAYPLLAPHWRVRYWAGGAGLLAVPALLAWLPEGRTWRAAGHVDNPLRVLFEAQWRARLAVLALASLLAAVAFQPGGLYGALFASRTLRLTPFSISLVLAASAPLAGFGFVAGGWLSDRAGRRPLAVGLSLASALVNALTFAGSVALYWGGNLAWSVVGSAAGPVLTAWYAELFPTRARATSQAVAAVAAAVGGILGLQLVGLAAPSVGLGTAIV